MKTNYFVYYKSWAITLIFGLCLLNIIWLQQFHWSFLFFGPALLLWGFLEIIDRHLWRFFPFSKMFILEDFSGTYKGHQICHRISPEGGKNVKTILHLTTIIEQTGSSINIDSFYYNSIQETSSKSKSESISLGSTKYGERYKLIYHYHNKGNGKWDGHFGTTVINIIKKEKNYEISGFYYTDRKPQTHGEFKNLRRKSRSKIHPF